VYIFAYGFFYWLFYLEIVDVSSTIVYFGIMGVTSFGMFLFCGSIGLIASYLFINFIYSQIKAD
jgi:transmembrane 9 superfamily protein 2/4